MFFFTKDYLERAEVNTDKYLRFYLLKIPYRPGGTNTFYALDMAEHYSFTTSHGDRSNAPNIVYVMTDGQSSSHSWTHNAAQHLKNSGVKVFVIGVGHVSIDELIDMATDHEHVFTVDSFSKLPSIQHLVEATYCDGKTVFDGLNILKIFLFIIFVHFVQYKC